MPFDLKPSALFFIVFVSVIAGLLFGSELVRWIMAGALVIVAGPLWISVRRFLRQQFWQDVSTVITASDVRDCLA